MKRILVVMVLIAVMTVTMVATALPAFAATSSFTCSGVNPQTGEPVTFTADLTPGQVNRLEKAGFECTPVSARRYSRQGASSQPGWRY